MFYSFFIQLLISSLKWQKEIKSDMETIKSLMNTRSIADQYPGLNDITTISLSKDISDRYDCDLLSFLLKASSMEGQGGLYPPYWNMLAPIGR